MSRAQCTVIAATYNQSRDLNAFLYSLTRQKNAPAYELIISDDGSQDNTRQIIEKYQPQFQGGIKHLWQEDQGFRKSKILNESIRQSSTDWLVLVDTDSVVHPLYLHDHFQMAASNRLFMGRRVDLSEEFSEWIRVSPEKAFTPEFYLKILSSKSRNIQRVFRWDSDLMRNLLKTDRVPDLLGSNFSVHKAVMEKVNGFNEDFENYWGEDGDLFIRIRNSGAEIIGRKSYAIQCHLWHHQREPLPGAIQAYQEKLNDFSYSFCAKGLR